MKRVVFTTVGASVLGLALLAAQAPATTKPVAAAPKPPAPAVQTAPRPVAAHAPVKPAAPAAEFTAEEQTAMVKQYCATCHNDRSKPGGLTFAAFDASQAVEHAPTVERMIRRLRSGMMPPAGARRPEGDALLKLATSLEGRIDRAAVLNPNPGMRPFQRANRAEYARAVRDLLGITIDVNAYLPSDTISKGFDNVADEQSLSPTVMEGFLRAAAQISRLAIGDRTAAPTSVTYKIPRARSQHVHVDGAPMGTRGGVSTVHIFPADGDYVFKAAMHYEPLGGLAGRTTMATLNLKEQIEVSIDGQRVAVLDLNTRMSESDPNEQSRAADAAHSSERWAAPGVGSVHQLVRGHC